VTLTIPTVNQNRKKMLLYNDKNKIKKISFNNLKKKIKLIYFILSNISVFLALSILQDR
jgi:hypothetical protein